MIDKQQKIVSNKEKISQKNVRPYYIVLNAVEDNSSIIFDTVLLTKKI